MEFTREETKVLQDAATVAADETAIQLTEMQLLIVGGGVADVTLS